MVFLIRSWTNIFLNTILILIQVYSLIELKRNKNMKESLHKSIAEIMAFFDFEKVAEIEETFFNEFAENEYDELVDVIKEFALENLYKCAEEFSDKKYNCWMESKYNLRFEYVYDENEPYMELKYIPVSWEK